MAVVTLPSRRFSRENSANTLYFVGYVFLLVDGDERSTVASSLRWDIANAKMATQAPAPFLFSTSKRVHMNRQMVQNGLIFQ